MSEVIEFDVSVGLPANNPMFSERQHAITRFLSFSKPVKCAHCGRYRRKHWTQLKFFQVMMMELAGLALVPSEKIYPPLTPVCEDHILKEI